MKWLWWFDKSFWYGVSGLVDGMVFGSGAPDKYFLLSLIPWFIGVLIGTRDRDTGQRLNS